MNSDKIAFVGGGNMATSLIGGLIADGHAPHHIRVSDPDREKLASLSERFRVQTFEDNSDGLFEADIVVLAVKPQVLRPVATALALLIQEQRPLVISIAAGIREADIERWLGSSVALVRAMPNTPALVQSSATVLHANPAVTDDQKDQAESILRAVGVTRWVEDEALIDAVTALSGSGPAYFFLVMETLERAGAELGLDPETAHLLTLQTALGAARMAMESTDPPAVLRQKVTSPGGTTERALAVLSEGGLDPLFRRALTAARDRSRELSELLGKD